MVQRISESLFLVGGGENAALIQRVGLQDNLYGVTGSTLSDTFKHVRWGETDNQPNTINRLLRKNSQVRGQLDSLRDLTFGSGLRFVKVGTDGATGEPFRKPFTDARLQEWVRRARVEFWAIEALTNYHTTANVFNRLVWDPQRSWFRLEVSDPFVTRIGKPGDDRTIREFLVNPNFGDRLYKEADSRPIPAFDPDDIEGAKAATVTLFHAKAPVAGNPYYSYPAWWCSDDWIELANLIPLFHSNGLKNGYNIKYLIRMPKDYFDGEGDRKVEKKEMDKKWSSFSDNLSKWMSGVKNVNKTMLIKYLRGADGKMLDNIDVIPLKNEMSDDAYAKVWEMANVSIANGMGILPTLAGVNPGKGNDSGSQIRVMADYQQHFRTPVVRRIVLEPVDHCLAAMGYADVEAEFAGVQITTLDVNPAGAQPVTNNA